MTDDLNCPECGRDELAYAYGTAHELCLWCTECGKTLVPSIHVIDALYELMQLRARVAELEARWASDMTIVLLEDTDPEEPTE